jgi:large exoprotein involved in heme utilization and adhesion
VTLTAPTLVIRGGRLAAETTGTRQAGAITLNAGSLTVIEQAQVTSSSTGAATGAAGIVTIQGLAGTGTAAGTVTLSDSALLTRTAGAGRGGDVVVETGTLTLTEGARLDSSTQGEGAGGTVTVRADATVTISP